jgi:hypothetical protein
MYDVHALGEFDTLEVVSGLEAAPHNGATNTIYTVTIRAVSNGHGVPECLYEAWLVNALNSMNISGRITGITDMDGYAQFRLTAFAAIGDTTVLWVQSGRKLAQVPIVIGALGADDDLTVAPPALADFAALAKSTPYVVTITAENTDPLEDAYYEASLVGAPTGTVLSGDTTGLTDSSGEATFTVTTGTVAGVFSLIVRSGLKTTTTACEVVA